MDTMLDYRLHAAILATEDRVRRHVAERKGRGPVRVHDPRLPSLGEKGRSRR